jgi:hypothetical protein
MYQYTTRRVKRRREPCSHAPAMPIATDSRMQLAASLTVVPNPPTNRLRSNVS